MRGQVSTPAQPADVAGSRVGQQAGSGGDGRVGRRGKQRGMMEHLVAFLGMVIVLYVLRFRSQPASLIGRVPDL